MDTQIAMRSEMQAKLSDYCKKISREFYLPEQKFVKDLVTGIVATGTMSVFNIAKHTNDKTTTKKTSERFYYNLHRDEQLRNSLYKVVCPQFNNDTIIICDESDITKSHARKMEGLSVVRDGSTGEQAPGYDLLNFIALREEMTGYSLLPVTSMLIAQDLELDTISQMVYDRIVDIAIHSNGKGIFTFDRGFDDRKLISFLRDNGIRFIIRGMGTRAVREGQQELNFKQCVAGMNFQHVMPGFQAGETLRCATRRIGVRTDDHPSKKANSVEVNLVVVRKFKRNKQKGKDFYLLCDFANEPLTEQEIIDKAVNGYKKRWKIEEAHRQMKKNLKIEKMRLASYTGLKNLNMLMWVALYFIYSAKRYIIKIALVFPKFFCFTKNDWKKLMEFSYYRLAQVLSRCFLAIRFYDNSLYKGKWTDDQQLKIHL